MKKIAAYSLLILISVVMLYPLLWLLGASFKTNGEIFSSAWFVPEHLDFSAYIKGWETVTPYTMKHYFLNTFKIIIPKTVFAVFSSVLVAYGFARFDFPLKKLFFVCAKKKTDGDVQPAQSGGTEKAKEEKNENAE